MKASTRASERSLLTEDTAKGQCAPSARLSECPSPQADSTQLRADTGPRCPQQGLNSYEDVPLWLPGPSRDPAPRAGAGSADSLVTRHFTDFCSADNGVFGSVYLMKTHHIYLQRKKIEPPTSCGHLARPRHKHLLRGAPPTQGAERCQSGICRKRHQTHNRVRVLCVGCGVYCVVYPGCVQCAHVVCGVCVYVTCV